MELWLSWYILDNKSRMAIILSSLLYARAPQPLRPTPHTPFFSLLWAVWTLIDELRGQWREDGTRMRMRGTSRYVQIVSFSSLSSISCISAAPFHLVVVAHILEAGEDMLKFCYHVKLLSFCSVLPFLRSALCAYSAIRLCPNSHSVSSCLY